MRTTRALMKTLADDFSAADQHRSHAWIRQRQPRAERRQFQRAAEETHVGFRLRRACGHRSFTVEAVYDCRTFNLYALRNILVFFSSVILSEGERETKSFASLRSGMTEFKKGAS